MPPFDFPVRIHLRRLASLAVWCTGIALVVAAPPVQSQEVETPAQAPQQDVATGGSRWAFSGFGTLGAVQQSGGKSWGLTRDSNQVGASSHLSLTPDTRLGGQINWTDGERWEAALQAVLMDVPTGTPVEEAFQWAYVGFRPTSTTRLRLGRTSPDIFLFAESRNVGFALPWVRPPVDFYGFFPLVSVDGGDLEQRWSSEDADWRARVTAGTVRSSVSDLVGDRFTIRARDVVAIGLTREASGLLTKVSYLRSRASIDVGGLSTLRDGLTQASALPIPGLAATLRPLADNIWTGGPVSYLGLGVQYDTGPWSLVAEASRLSVPSSSLSARRGYVSFGWRHGRVTYYGLASRVLPDRPSAETPALAATLTPVIGAEAAAQVQALAGYAAQAGNGYRYDQATIGAGLRWDFTATAALKVQFDRFDVHRNGGAGWRFYDNTAGNGTLLSVAIDFVVGQ